MNNIINLTNQKFNDFLVLEFDSIKNHKAFWRVRCEPCNNEFIKCGTDIKRGKIKNCGCLKNKKEKNGNWKGHQDIWGKTISHYEFFAKKRNIYFDLNIESVWEIYLKQNKKCPYTGLDLVLKSKTSKSRTPLNASLDRIDSSKGYTKDNVQWVYKKVNIIKNTLTHKEFIELCNLIAKNCPI